MYQSFVRECTDSYRSSTMKTCIIVYVVYRPRASNQQNDQTQLQYRPKEKIMHMYTARRLIVATARFYLMPMADRPTVHQEDPPSLSQTHEVA